MSVLHFQVKDASQVAAIKKRVLDLIGGGYTDADEPVKSGGAYEFACANIPDDKMGLVKKTIQKEFKIMSVKEEQVAPIVPPGV
jgi:hypothetical protein